MLRVWPDLRVTGSARIRSCPKTIISATQQMSKLNQTPRFGSRLPRPAALRSCDHPPTDPPSTKPPAKRNAITPRPCRPALASRHPDPLETLSRLHNASPSARRRPRETTPSDPPRGDGAAHRRPDPDPHRHPPPYPTPPYPTPPHQTPDHRTAPRPRRPCLGDAPDRHDIGPVRPPD